ncbi:MAG: hypothetical protein C0399_00690 [Syntrophus sp. (in: bacteria)]|nr:hypothetical protein [Syntrophus sp. (in: bacteria)]
MSKAQRVSLRVSVDEQHRGLKNLDFFADHTVIDDMKFTPNRVSTVIGPLYLRTALTTITCPLCNEQVKRNIKDRPIEWFLKFAGRKILYCTSCNWKEIVKENRWEWEIVAPVLAVFLIVCFASIYWILR